ncbi:hypothetical protein MKW98_023930 [Papaver atlanticum]|uniref:Retrotransposon gag domain-containing protein n=1 Tax=Papaver atlanticum TaxID=357466 RepID=A0AAD4SZQ6_9MAGN|nr:hypothetical protein MKW98_023930 [Papaver atlanticum]
MSGRGRGARNASNARGNGKGKVPNFTVAITILILNQNGNHNAPPPPGENMNDNNHQGGGPQTEWMNLLEKFIKLKPPVFECSTDSLVVDKWNEDIDKTYVAMRCTHVQRQQLVVFQLFGEARKWWNNASIGLHLDTLTYIQFCERLDARYYLATIRDKKINKFAEVAHIRGELVDDYLDKYIRLSQFVMFMIQDEEKSVRRFDQVLATIFVIKWLVIVSQYSSKLLRVLELLKLIGCGIRKTKMI